MAWYALYKWFRIFRKSPSTNYIAWYKQYLYDEWFKSLSDVEKTAENRRQKRIAQAKEREFREAIARLGVMHSLLYDASVRAGGKHARTSYMETQMDTIGKIFK